MLIVKGQEVMNENAQYTRTLYDEDVRRFDDNKMTSGSFGALLMRLWLDFWVTCTLYTDCQRTRSYDLKHSKCQPSLLATGVRP